MKVSWCPIRAMRITGVMNVTSTVFAEYIENPENAKDYDDMYKDVKVVETRASGAVCMHATFTTPSFIVSPRDVSTVQINALLPLETIQHFNLKLHESIAPPEDSSDYIKTPGVFVNSGMSITHPKIPDPFEKYVRGIVHRFGWIVEPISPEASKVSLLLSFDPSGSIPKKIVEIANGVQVKKWEKVKKHLESKL